MTDHETGLLRERVVSIDALRGFDMFFLIGGFAIIHAVCGLVQTPWSDAVAAQLKHTDWHGFHFVDLIFPLFLFLVGASMAFSFEKRQQRGDSRKALYLHAVKRSLLLFLLGLVYNGLLDFDFSNFYYTGVLQRIAVSYFIAALIVINTGIKGQAVAAVSLLLAYWIIDVRQYSKWAFPLVVIGLNPLTIYVAQKLFNFRIIADIFVHGFIDYFGDLKPIVLAMCVFAVKWLFLYFLYRQKIFLRV